MWIADWHLTNTTCPECGNPREECTDAARSWFSYRQVCYATMERESAKEAYDDLHADAPFHDGTFTSWAAKRSKSHPYRHDAGVVIDVAATNLAPWDKFTTERDASPLEPPEPYSESSM